MNKFAFELGRTLVKSSVTTAGVMPALERLLSVLGRSGVTAAKRVGSFTGLRPALNDVSLVHNARRGLRGAMQGANPLQNGNRLHQLLKAYTTAQNTAATNRLMRGGWTGTGILAADSVSDRFAGKN